MYFCLYFYLYLLGKEFSNDTCKHGDNVRTIEIEQHLIEVKVPKHPDHPP